MFWLGLEPATSRLPVRCLNHCRTTPQNVIQRRQKLLWTVAECLQCRLLPQEFTNDRLSERTSIWTYVRDRQWLAEGGGWQSGVGDRLRVSGVRRTLVAAECVVRCHAELHSAVDDNRNAIDWAATSPQGYNIWEIIAVNGGTTNKTQWYSPYNTKRDNSVLRFVTVLAPCINYLKLSYLLTYVSFNVGGDSERSNILIKNNTKIASHQAPQLGKSLFTILIIRQFKKYM